MQRIGTGFNGIISKVFEVRYYLRVSTVLVQAGIDINKMLHPCLETSYEKDIYCINPGCGNGIVNSTLDSSSEQCDDANTLSGDGCSSTCQIEDLFVCNTNTFIDLTSCTYDCGNGKLNTSVKEECDDGNADSSDGCSSLCKIESGWTCSGAVGSKSTCSSICGDGLLVGSEVCDDGNKSDGKGCLSDCSGSVNGWYCSGGSLTTPDVCSEQCGDGYITVDEQCEDGNSISGDGCFNCQIESGWTCTSSDSRSSTCITHCGDGLRAGSEVCDDGNTDGTEGCNADCSGVVLGWQCYGGSETSKDVCTTVCGDGIKISNEACDDGNATDGKGCLNDCSGIARGWYCNPGNPYICYFVLMDGVRAINGEDCDDGNSIDFGDGCTNSGKFESNWSCKDDILGKSICRWICGDGYRNANFEQCDDYNNDNGDGCSYSCTVENNYQCIGGSISTRDYCYIKPNVKLASIDTSNLIILSFDKPMKIFNISSIKNSFNVAITGPKNTYKFSYTSNFSSENKISFQLNLIDQTIGYGVEKLTIEFSDNFLSTEGTILKTNKISTSIYPKEEAPQAIKDSGTATTNILGITMGMIVFSNVLLGDKIELLWGFTNTLQIISYFPYLTLYLPQYLTDFIKSLAIVNFNIHISYIDDPIDNFKNSLFKDNVYDLNNNDQSLENNGIDSLSIIKNASGMLIILFQGMITCFIFYAIKAKCITIPESINQEIQINSKNETSNTKERKENKFVKWIKEKLISTCDDYRYLFFLRLGFQLYLECCLLTLLNLSRPRFDNWAQILSYCVALIIVAILLCFPILIVRFIKVNLTKIQKGELTESHPFSLLYYEYKPNCLINLIYHVFFMLRRFCYAAVIIFAGSNIFIQNSCVIICCVAICSYQIVFRPYKSILFNIFMCLNESLLVVITWGFYIFVDPNENESLVSIAGWIILGIIMFLVIINIGLLWTVKIIAWYRVIHSFISILMKAESSHTKQRLSHKFTNNSELIINHEKIFEQEVARINSPEPQRIQDIK